MRLREALVRSRNLVSIRVMHALGPSYTTQYIERFGFPAANLPPNLTLALGTAQVSPLEMTSAYAVFANGGYKVDSYYIDRIVGPDGNQAYESQPRIVCRECVEQAAAEATAELINVPEGAPPPPTVDERSWGGLSYLPEKLIAQPSISPQNDYLMVDMMADVVRRGTAARAMQLRREDLAGKTGTTNDRRDAWFCGFNSALVGTAWVGFDNERSLGPGEEGSRTALPMWIYFMHDALQGVPQVRRAPPPGLVTMRVSADTGLAARPGEPNAIFETFMAGHLPAEAEGGDGMSNGSVPEQSSDDPIF